MSSFFQRVARLVPFASGKRLAGKDLEGNRYYELPPANGGRNKRVVEYKVSRDLAEYTSGAHRLPIQWTTWLSHTRADPPTLDELQRDSSRRDRLGPLVAAIEERETEERIRQGYLPAPDPQTGGSVGAIAGPSQPARHSGIKYSVGGSGGGGSGSGGRMNAAPSFAPRASASTSTSISTSGESAAGRERPAQIAWQSVPPSARQTATTPAPPPTPAPAQTQTQAQAPSAATAASPGVAPPAQTVDPSRYSSPDELRRLAEQDMRRRIEEGTATPVPDGSADGVQSAGRAGFRPARRRGAAAV